MTTSSHRLDAELRTGVPEQLNWVPGISGSLLCVAPGLSPTRTKIMADRGDSAEVEAHVAAGVVTPTGTVRTGTGRREVHYASRSDPGVTVAFHQHHVFG